VHRATVYHRLARVERILGIDLHDGLEHLGLHLALLLRRIEVAAAIEPNLTA
jgi:DNA-binding PucR family transcriptional regulator